MTTLKAIAQRTLPAAASRIRLSFAWRVFLLALAVRLVPVLLTARLGIGLDDMFQYDMLARSLVAGHGYRWYAQPDLDTLRPYINFDLSSVPYDPQGIPTSYRAPLYPVLLALVYAVSGLQWRFFAARLVQAVLGATLAPLTYAIARRVLALTPLPSPQAWGEGPAVPLSRSVGEGPAVPLSRSVGEGLGVRAEHIAAWIVAFYPWLVLYPLGLASENLFFVLLAVAILALLRASDSGALRDWALAGIALGLAALTRSIILGFVPFAILIAAGFIPASLRRRLGLSPAASSNRIRGPLVLIACIAALTLPWIWRNTRLHGHLTFIENNLGNNLYLGYHPKSTGTFQFGISLDLVPILDDAERNRRGLEAAWGFIRADPGRVPYLIVRKLGYFWGLEKRVFIYFYSNNYLGHWSDPLIALALLVLCLPFVLLMPAAILGLTLPARVPQGEASARLRRGTLLLLTLILYFTAVHALILAEDRYHLPLVPLLAVFAAQGVVSLTQIRNTGMRAGDRAHLWRRVLATVLIGLLVLNWGLELSRDVPRLAAMFGPNGNTVGTDY